MQRQIQITTNNNRTHKFLNQTDARNLTSLHDYITRNLCCNRMLSIKPEPNICNDKNKTTKLLCTHTFSSIFTRLKHFKHI